VLYTNIYQLKKPGFLGPLPWSFIKTARVLTWPYYGRKYCAESGLSVMLNEQMSIPLFFDIVHDDLRNGSLKSHIGKYGEIFYYGQKYYSDSNN